MIRRHKSDLPSLVLVGILLLSSWAQCGAQSTDAVREKLVEQAISVITNRFPEIQKDDLELRQFSYMYGTDYGGAEYYGLAFWIKSTVNSADTNGALVVTGEEIQVMFNEAGLVERDAVTRSRSEYRKTYGMTNFVTQRVYGNVFTREATEEAPRARRVRP